MLDTIYNNNEVIHTLIDFISKGQRKILKKISEDSDIRKLTKPIFNTTLNILKRIDKLSIKKAKELITRSIEITNGLILENMSDNSHLVISEDKSEDEYVLPPVTEPYLPKLDSSRIYTLVLDLDETLVHYVENETDPELLIRPGCQKFLKEMSETYELVIFTAAMQDYADWVIDQIDTEGGISHRLYRQHTSADDDGTNIKDLSKIGRDLTKTIIVDNVAENFQKQPENGILIKSWYDDPNDDALFELGPLLQAIAKMKPK